MGQWRDGDCYASTVDFVQKFLNAPELHWQCGGVAGSTKVHDEMKLGNNTQLSGAVAGWRLLCINSRFYSKIS